MKNSSATTVIIAVGLAACSSAARSNFSDVTSPDPDAGVVIDPDGGIVSGNDGGTMTPGSVLLYAHTAKELFKLDPASIASPMVSIGLIDCIGGSSNPSSLTDVGVSKDGAVYGVSSSGAYPFVLPSGAGKVHCAATWPLPGTHTNFYGLTMAPENTLDAQEVLVAANDAGQLFRIDATTGATTQVGTMGTDTVSGKAWALSGDIVFLANMGSPVAFATVCPAGNCGGTDTLIELDVSKVTPGTASALKSVRGPIVKGAWCTNAASPASFGSIFGIAAYDDKVYGFSNKGELIEIHNIDGSACLVKAYANTSFKGAGVTTSAPVIAPK
ncbi:MAG: hypothetical protein ABIP89_02555 [Polyangiaceae bacterium]